MMECKYLSIDPGKSGGLGWIDAVGKVAACNMPDEEVDLIEFIRDLEPRMVIMEDVKPYHRYGNGASRSTTFADHCGGIRGIVKALSFPLSYVHPKEWMKFILQGTITDKTERKNTIKRIMSDMYPDLRVTLKTADALGILTWNQCHQNQKLGATISDILKDKFKKQC